MKTRCENCQMLCDAQETHCMACSAPLAAIRGVDESSRWNGKVRSQWRQETATAKSKNDKFQDWLERDITQAIIIIAALATFSVITLLSLLFLVAIGIA